MKKVVLRADAGDTIGYGHFIRTLALADMLKDSFKCTLVTQTPSAYQRAEVAPVCSLVELPSTNEKFRLFLELLQGDEIVVLDNYFYDTDYQASIRAKGCKLICIDDMHDRHYVADIVINHGLTDAYLFSVEPYTRLCLGLEWALLRAPFLESSLKCRRPAVIKNIVTGFGGSDPWNLTGKVLDILKTLPGIESITVIVGDGYRHPFLSDSRFCYRKNLGSRDIAHLFEECDLAVLPASTMTLEALACGCVVACGYFVDNQKEIFHQLVKEQKVLPVGDFFSDDLNVRIKSVFELPYPLPWLKGDIKRRYLGLFRVLSVADYRFDDFTFIDYRDLSLEQSFEVWQMRMDDRIRFQMVNTDFFSFDDHVDFIRSLSASNDRIYWAVYKDQQFVGSLNLRWFDEHSVERGIFLNPCFLGQGLAGKMEEAFRGVYAGLGIREVRAEVKKGNLRSLNYHLKSGYELVEENDDFYFLTKLLDAIK